MVLVGVAAGGVLGPRLYVGVVLSGLRTGPSNGAESQLKMTSLALALVVVVVVVGAAVGLPL